MKLTDNLDALLRRQESLRDKIVQARIAKQKAEKKDHTKEFAVVGETVVSHAKANPKFKLMMKEIMPSIEMDDDSRTYLKEKGWL